MTANVVSGIVAAYLQKQYGGQFTIAVSNPATGATSAQLVKNNPDRAAMTIINVGANSVYLQPLSQQSGSTGIILGAAGGVVTMDMINDLILPSVEWWGVSPAGASSLTIIELLRFA